MPLEACVGLEGNNRNEGIDPGSLCHLKQVLGITAMKAEYNTCKRFTSLCGKAFALAAFCEILGAGSFEQLKAKIKERNEYVGVVEKVVEKLFIPRLARYVLVHYLEIDK